MLDILIFLGMLFSPFVYVYSIFGIKDKRKGKLIAKWFTAICLIPSFIFNPLFSILHFGIIMAALYPYWEDDTESSPEEEMEETTEKLEEEKPVSQKKLLNGTEDLSDYTELVKAFAEDYGKKENNESALSLQKELLTLQENLSRLQKIEIHDDSQSCKIEKFCDTYLPTLVINLEKGLRFYTKNKSLSIITNYTQKLSVAINEIIDIFAEQEAAKTWVEVESLTNMLRSQGYAEENPFAKKKSTSIKRRWFNEKFIYIRRCALLL